MALSGLMVGSAGLNRPTRLPMSTKRSGRRSGGGSSLISLVAIVEGGRIASRWLTRRIDIEPRRNKLRPIVLAIHPDAAVTEGLLVDLDQLHPHLVVADAQVDVDDHH